MWETLAINLSLQVGLWALNKYVFGSDPPKLPPPEVVRIATTQEGTPIPIVYGTARVDQPVLVWWGNAGAFIDATGQSYGYRVDMIFNVGIPMLTSSKTSTFIRRIWWGDVLANSPFDGSHAVGEKHGSISGDGVDAISVKDTMEGLFQFRAGSSVQTLADGGLAGLALTNGGYDSTLIPAFRNQMIVALTTNTPTTDHSETGSIGTSPSPPQAAFEVSTAIGANRGTGADGLPDENPADVIQDILTGSVWKIGLSSSDLDLTSFSTAASTLLSEGNLYSAVHDSHDDAVSILRSILGQTNGVLFQDPSTGLIVYKLVRAAVPSRTVTQDNVHKDGLQYQITSWSEVYNQVRVTFQNRFYNYQQGTATAQNLSVLAMHGNRPRVLEVTYPGVKTKELASKLASRDLALASRPLGKLSTTLDRSFYDLLPGDVLSVTLPKYGISAMTMRVMTVDLGDIMASGVKVTLVEDAFDAGTQYGVQGATTTTIAPDPITTRLLVESPRYWALQLANTGAIPDPDAPVLLSVAKNDDTASSYDVQSYAPNTTVQSINALANNYQNDIPRHAFPTTFTLVSDYARELEPYDTTTGITIANLANFPASLGVTFESLTCTDGTLQAVLVRADGTHEFISFESVTNLGGSPTQYRLNNVWRGLLDTPPIAHSAGERGYIVSQFAIGRISYNVGRTVNAKELPWIGSTRGS